ncbi:MULTISPECIES: MerR family transcriptional regulator [unclassified Streptomyces]|uniref:MerR family transcriptional regulator n=1 Tax=unclassified Streptomyces TaxID=2593676 RepID=UPI0006AEFCEC|nr:MULTISPECIES: MerR family transcriptional regulator [unclassified Streptomyces]
MRTYRISQLAERSGVPATTLRFYEDAGLLTAGRTPAGYRVYGEDAVERLAFVSSAKLLGLTLDEIRELLDVREEGACASVRARLLPLVEARIAETADRVAELRAFSARLAAVRADLSGPAPGGPCGPDCGCATAGTTTVTTAGTPAAPESIRAVCALDGAGFDERAGQWRRLVGRAGAREEIPGGLRLSFPADPGLAGEIADLAAAEQDCCAFFDFTLHLAPAALRLDVRAPASAARSLAALFGDPV